MDHPSAGTSRDQTKDSPMLRDIKRYWSRLKRRIGIDGRDRQDMCAVTRVDSEDHVTAKPEAAQETSPHKGECQDWNGNSDRTGDGTYGTHHQCASQLKSADVSENLDATQDQ